MIDMLQAFFLIYKGISKQSDLFMLLWYCPWVYAFIKYHVI